MKWRNLGIFFTNSSDTISSSQQKQKCGNSFFVFNVIHHFSFYKKDWLRSLPKFSKHGRGSLVYISFINFKQFRLKHHRLYEKHDKFLRLRKLNISKVKFEFFCLFDSMEGKSNFRLNLEQLLKIEILIQ